jgi:hypothetical protein
VHRVFHTDFQARPWRLGNEGQILSPLRQSLREVHDIAKVEHKLQWRLQEFRNARKEEGQQKKVAGSE